MSFPKRICFTLKSKNISSGGGNFFVGNLVRFLTKQGVDCIFSLTPQKPIDIFFVMDPRKNSTNLIPIEEVARYKQAHPNTLIIHRVNENDLKREKPIGIEQKLLPVFQLADRIVFVSEWLKNYYLQKYPAILGPKSNKCLAILNGVDRHIFNPSYLNDSAGQPTGIKSKPVIKLVTHHWSNNYLKGFYIYNQLDELIGQPGYEHYQLTFIGNYHSGHQPKNIRLLPPMTGTPLADELRNHDLYLTATQYEPGAMHYLEGASCGLPVLYYQNGGGAHEICQQFGEEYRNLEELFEKIGQITEQYEDYRRRIPYDFLGAVRCSTAYGELITDLSTTD